MKFKLEFMPQLLKLGLQIDYSLKFILENSGFNLGWPSGSK